MFFFSSRRRHTRLTCDWSSDVCSSDLRGRHARVREELFALARRPLEGVRELVLGVSDAKALAAEIGRASCRERCRYRWWPYREKTKKRTARQDRRDRPGEERITGGRVV